MFMMYFIHNFLTTAAIYRMMLLVQEYIANHICTFVF
jgi:hypothetical protein